MNTRKNSRTSLFLMELIVVIFFFSLSAVVCVRLFVFAHLLAEKSINISNAVTWSQNLAEAFYGNDGSIEKLSFLYPYSISTDNTLILVFDKNWESTGINSDASYEVIITTHTAAAEEIYSDMKEDYPSVTLTGNAIAGQIAVIDIRDLDAVLPSIPKEADNILLSGQVDTYIGKETK